MKIYISGSITDGGTVTDPDEIKAREQMFHDAQARLETAGYDVLNPCRKEGRENCVTWLDYMRPAIRDIADADAVALLPGWERSSGARVEHDLAVALGLKVDRLVRWMYPAAGL